MLRKRVILFVSVFIICALFIGIIDIAYAQGQTQQAGVAAPAKGAPAAAAPAAPALRKAKANWKKWIKTPQTFGDRFATPKNWYEEWMRIEPNSEYKIQTMEEKMLIQNEFIQYAKDKYKLSDAEYSEVARIVRRILYEYQILSALEMFMRRAAAAQSAAAQAQQPTK